MGAANVTGRARRVTRGGKPRLIIDFRYTNADGRRARCKRDAAVQTLAAAYAEARRLMSLAAETGSLEQVPVASASPAAKTISFEQFVVGPFEALFMLLVPARDGGPLPRSPQAVDHGQVPRAAARGDHRRSHPRVRGRYPAARLPDQAVHRCLPPGRSYGQPSTVGTWTSCPMSRPGSCARVTSSPTRLAPRR